MMDFPTTTANGKTTVHTRCIDCGRRKDLTVETSHYDAWRGGALIQRAIPELSADDRELLISGTCTPCWDAMFDDDGEAA